VAGGLYSWSLTIFLTVPLKILPLLVFGSFVTKITPSSLQKAATSALILALISLAIYFF